MGFVLNPLRVDARPLILPLAPLPVPAGFPSPAQDYYEGPIDLTGQLVRDKAATFIVRVVGDSMEGQGSATGTSSSSTVPSNRVTGTWSWRSWTAS